MLFVLMLLIDNCPLETRHLTLCIVQTRDWASEVLALRTFSVHALYIFCVTRHGFHKVIQIDGADHFQVVQLLQMLICILHRCDSHHLLSRKLSLYLSNHLQPCCSAFVGRCSSPSHSSHSSIFSLKSPIEASTFSKLLLLLFF